MSPKFCLAVIISQCFTSVGIVDQTKQLKNVGGLQNVKTIEKNTKIIIAGYSPNRNWWNLIGTTSTSTSSGTR
jgi:hypothetical protein